MNKFFSIIIAMLVCFCASAQLETNQVVKLSSKGTLKSQLTTEEWNSISSLKIKGELGSEDFIFLRSLHLKHLDLSGIDNKTFPTKALQGCSSLETVVLPEDMVSLGVAAFMHCTSLQSIKLPKKLTDIHSLAFSECSTLKKVIIPKNVQNISAGAFYSCTNLSDITVETGNSKYFSVGGIVYSSDSSIVVCPAGMQDTVFVQSYVSTIENAAFGGCEKLTTIILPNKITKIGDGAFWNCKKLHSIQLPDSLQSLGNGVFLGSGLTSVVWNSNITDVPSETFKNCNALKSISIPSNIVTIGSGVFQGCANLSSVVIPQSVRNIGDCAFMGCTSLKNISLPDDLNSIGQDAFASSGLSAIMLPAHVVKIQNGTFAQCLNLSKVQLSSQTASIGNSAFLNCSKLSNISIPKSVSEIGDNAFSGTSISFISLPDGLKTISKASFKNCASLVYAQIPSSVSEIDEEAFAGCGFKEITLPNNIIGIADASFRKCTNLVSVSLPLNLLVLGSNVFAECDNLKTIHCEAVNPPKVGYSAFTSTTENSALLYVNDEVSSAYKSNASWGRFSNIVGNYVLNVTRPGLMSFMITDSMWTNLQNIKITGTLNHKDLVFLSNLMHRGCHIKVLDMENVEGITSFSLNDEVKKYNNKINDQLKVVYLPLTVNTIPNNAFEGFAGLENVVIPKSVTSIGSNAFANCVSLSSFNGENVQNIGDYCFLNCKKLESFVINNNNYKSVDGILYSQDMKELVAYPCGKVSANYTMPNSIEKIRKGACANSHLSNIELSENLNCISDSSFVDCRNLQSITIGGTVETIGNSAFLQDSSLSMVILSEGVKTIGISAFQNCNNLQTVDVASSVIKIGNYAFWNCTNIENFINRAEHPQEASTNIIPKRFSANSGKLYVEESAMSKFRNSPVWSKFSSIESLSLGR